MCPKSNELSAWTNWLTYDEWFEHFRERSKKRVISEERITLVLDYLK